MSVTKNLNDFKVEQKVINNVPVWETSYQPVNDRGEPVGSRTFLRAASQEKLLEKVAEAHASAAVFGQRWRSRAVQPSQPARPRLTNIEKAELLQKANTGDVEASERLMNNNLLEQIAADEETRRQNIVSQEFMAENPRFQPCQANAAAMSAFLQSDYSDWTVANLQRAFDTLSAQNKLALREVKTEPAIEPTPSPTPAGKTSAELGINEDEPFCPLLAESKNFSADELRKKLKDPDYEKRFNEELAQHNAFVARQKEARLAEILKKATKRLEGVR